MAFSITENLKQALQSNEVTPVIVARIAGYDNLFGNATINKYVRIGDPDLYIGNDWVIGGFRIFGEQEPLITFNTGTTAKITQKLDPTRGQGSSVSSMVLSFVDKNEAMTQFVSPGFVLEDVLSRDVTVYLGLKETSWPEDYNVIFRGVISGIDSGSGYVNLILSNTEEKKRARIISPKHSVLDANVDFKSATFQSLFYKNRSDVSNFVSVTYTGGGTAGSEVVSVVGYAISVQIQSGVSTAGQIKKKVENDPSANQLVEIEVAEGFDSSDTQVTGSANLIDDLSMTVEDQDIFYDPRDEGAFRTFVRIDDELIEYQSSTAGSFTDLTRSSEFTQGAVHEIGANVDQVLRLAGNGLTLALKLLLSTGPTYYIEDLAVTSIIYYDGTSTVSSGLIFSAQDLESDLGIAIGDYIDIFDSAVFTNNISGLRVVEIGLINGDTYIVVDTDALTLEGTTTATIRIQSQFNTLPIGLGLHPKDVDVKQHLFIRDTYLPGAEMVLFVQDIPNGKDFIEQKIYLPLTCFSVPRKGRSSVAYHIGPLPTYNVVQLNIDTVKNPESLKVQRGLSENFYNQITINFDKNVMTGEYATPRTYDGISKAQVPIGDRPLVIDADGLRTYLDAENIAQRTADRFLKRYQFGAEFIKGVQVMLNVGYEVEIGDIVAVDFASLKLTDTATGTRSGAIKLYEILNKVLDQKTGDVSLDIVNTIFQNSDRFGLIAPTTMIAPGSTVTKVLMKKSFNTRDFEKESRKWSDKIGQDIIIHNEDWTTVYTTKIRGFDSNDPQGMTVDALPAPPGEDWFIDIPRYPHNDDQDDQAFWKLRYSFFSPEVLIVDSTDQDQFEVDPADTEKFFVGSIVRISNFDYVDDSGDLEVIDVDSINNIITLESDVGFTMTDEHKVNLIGFLDKQPSYRIT